MLKTTLGISRGQVKRFITQGSGKKNDEDIIVTSGLREGEIVTLESPADAAKRSKKKL